MTRCALRVRGMTAVVAVLFLAILPQSPAAAAESPPNIVFVLFDDLGWPQAPCYRAATGFQMPNLDRLAREGMRFTDAHAAAAVCTPTRYGVLTGRYPWRIGQFGVLTTYSKPLIPKERLTVASLLKQHGYATACVGKWHLGLNWVDGKPGSEGRVPLGAKTTDGPNALGFDYFCGYTHARSIGTVIEQDRVVEHVEPVESQPLMIEKAVAWIDARAKAGGPFFLYFPMCPPHTPVVPAPDVKGKSGVEGKESAYGDWIYQGDQMLGQILDALDRNRVADKTLVIVASDNGAEHREYPPLRASKRSIYEGGHREPLLVRWPGKVKAGSTCAEVVCLNDLLATAAELVGAKLPHNAGEDSVSFLPAILGTAKGPLREATVHQSMGGDLAIRQGPWKLVFLKSGRQELYRLDTDLGETTDLSAANPEIVARLARLMQSYIDRGRSTAGQPQKNQFSPSLAGGKPPKKSKKRS